MKTFVHLKVEAEGHYSGATYEDEVFLTPEMYEAIGSEIGTEFNCGELDGKHSEVITDIDVQFLTEQDLATFPFLEGGDGGLHDLCTDYLWDDKKELEAFKKLQSEVLDYLKVQEMTIKFNKDDKEKIEELLKGYIL